MIGAVHNRFRSAVKEVLDVPAMLSSCSLSLAKSSASDSGSICARLGLRAAAMTNLWSYRVRILATPR